MPYLKGYLLPEELRSQRVRDGLKKNWIFTITLFKGDQSKSCSALFWCLKNSSLIGVDHQQSMMACFINNHGTQHEMMP